MNSTMDQHSREARLKMRQHVEQVVDRLCNYILAEGSYMRSDDRVHWYILDRLKAVGLLKHWSVDEEFGSSRLFCEGVRDMLSKLGFDAFMWG